MRYFMQTCNYHLENQRYVVKYIHFMTFFSLAYNLRHFEFDTTYINKYPRIVFLEGKGRNEVS